MNRKTLIAATGAALLGLAGLTAYAAGGPTPPADGSPSERGPGPGGHPGPGGPDGPGFGADFLPHDLIAPGMGKRMADKLDLTPEQRTTIKGYFEAARPTLQSLREEMRKNTQLLRDTQPDAQNYSSVVSQASKKAGELASRLVTEGSQLRAQIWKTLTPEQRTKLDEMRATFKDHAKNRWKGRGGPRGPQGPSEGDPGA